MTAVSLLCCTRRLGEAALLPPHAVLQATSSVLQAASIRDLAGWQERGWEGKWRLWQSGGGGGLQAASCGALTVQSNPVSAPRPPATTSCSTSSHSAPSSITAAVIAREEEAPIWSCRGSWQLGVAAAGLAVGCSQRLEPDTEADSVQAIHVVYCKVHLYGVWHRYTDGQGSFSWHRLFSNKSVEPRADSSSSSCYVCLLTSCGQRYNVLHTQIHPGVVLPP